ncbi:hypothetical protein ACIOD1_34385 [Streptomyces sp. NPDC088097]|uniref:hypothetical protein n=1 Tax=Streptomyces sp. NPDC088097 TaxID=3365823 RepID=UPI00381CA80A
MSLSLHWDGATEGRVMAEFAEQSIRVGTGSAFDGEPGSVWLAFTGVDAAGAVRAADRVARLAGRAAGAPAPNRGAERGQERAYADSQLRSRCPGP